MLDLVIFSKDRACQLDLLLRSIKRFLEGWTDLSIRVIHTHADERLGRGYEIVQQLHPEFEWVSELASDRGFRGLTLDAVGHNPYVSFLVDDDVFKEPFSL
ncbi:MAG: hypothetical protein ACJ76V_14075, partial [Thermoleophilaceae bacterium]